MDFIFYSQNQQKNVIDPIVIDPVVPLEIISTIKIKLNRKNSKHLCIMVYYTSIEFKNKKL